MRLNGFPNSKFDTKMKKKKTEKKSLKNGFPNSKFDSKMENKIEK